jgi:alpha-tubulin suppressor-like RCC1 family protein
MIASGYHHTCALNSEGDLYCWGFNGNGQLGTNGVPASYSDIPVAVDMFPIGSPVSGLAAYGDHTCVTTAGGRSYCWGKNSWGQIGNMAAMVDALVPDEVYLDNL